ncbi:MAG: hypothetical protein R3F56_10795 [Planctomycetota bacterium]
MRLHPTLGSVVLLALIQSGCSTSPRDRHPLVRELYRDAALREARNPVIVIHGILGARLEEHATKRSVWGAFTGDYANPETPVGARLLALPLQPPADAFAYDPADAAVGASEPLAALRLDIVFGVLSVKVYADILRTLGIGGYRDRATLDPNVPAYADDHFTCHTFFYDWRRDNVENAIQLGRFIRRTRADIDAKARGKIERLRAAGDDASLAQADELAAWLAKGYRFDIVAHSMGGLIAHYYLRYGEADLPQDGSTPEVTWAGAREVDRLIQVGTPNFGAIDALRELHDGFKPAFFLPRFDAALLGTMPSIYQLLPRTRHGVLLRPSGDVADADLLAPRLWLDNGWGLAAPAADRVLAWLLPDVPDADERRRLARTYLTWCLERAARFHAALDAPASTTPRTRFYLFAADGERTLARAVLTERGGRMVPTFSSPTCYLPGDLTVPRYSALGDERTGADYRAWLPSPLPWTNVTFLSDDHVGLTRNPHFVDNMLFVLMETRPPVTPDDGGRR